MRRPNQTVSSLNISRGAIPPLIKYKIVMLGDQSVGKSSIINRFIHDIFDASDTRPTIGIDFISQNIFLEEKVIRLQLWDTAGQERFRTLIPSYVRDAAIAVIVYDVTNRASFNSVSEWVADVRRQRSEDVILCLAANKADLAESRVVSRQEGQFLAAEQSLIFKEMSAKSGLNVQQFFKEIAGLLPGTDINRLNSEVSIPQVEDRRAQRQGGQEETRPGGTPARRRCAC